MKASVTLRVEAHSLPDIAIWLAAATAADTSLSILELTVCEEPDE